MDEQYRNKPAVDNWLCNGGSEIVLAVLRRYGWKIDVLMQDDWDFVDDVVVVGDREQKTMAICGAKSPWQQAFFAALLYERHDPAQSACGNFRRPVFCESDKFRASSIWLCYSFIDKIRVSSEVTAELMVNLEKLL